MCTGRGSAMRVFASFLYLHSSRSLTQLLVQFLGSGMVEVEGVRGTQVAGICERKYLWSKTWSNLQGVHDYCAGFFRGKSCWSSLQSRLLGTSLTLTMWLIPKAPVFPPRSQPSLHISTLPVSGQGKFKEGCSCGAPKVWKSWLLTFLSLSH